MTLDRGPSFWTEQCPARGAGLKHAHWNKCAEKHDPKHYIDQCCECGGRASEWLFSSVNSENIPDYSVAERLKRMGLMSATPSPPPQPPHADDELIEPKATTGFGPRGSKYGRGRMSDGKLSYRDKLRLTFYVHKVRHRTYEDEPDAGSP